MKFIFDTTLIISIVLFLMSLPIYLVYISLAGV